MAAFIDNVLFNPAAGGTADFAVSTATQGYLVPSAAGAVGGAMYGYKAQSADLSEWEVGQGFYSSGGAGTLARTRVLANSLGTTAKINFSAVPTVGIVALSEDLVVPRVLRGYLTGLKLSTAGSSTTFAVAAGCAVDDLFFDYMERTASISKTTGAWAVGSGNGSLDTGSIANSTWYHVHLIKRLDTDVVDVLTSLSATAPTLPTNYTISRRIGSMKTNGSAQWTKFVQDGDVFTWDTPVADVSVANPGTAAVTRTLTVPTGVRVEARLSVGTLATAAADFCPAVYVSDLSVADVTPNLSAAFTNETYVAASPSAVAGGSEAGVFTNTSAQVRSRCQLSTAGLTFTILTRGWRDTRGKDG